MASIWNNGAFRYCHLLLLLSPQWSWLRIHDATFDWLTSRCCNYFLFACKQQCIPCRINSPLKLQAQFRECLSLRRSIDALAFSNVRAFPEKTTLLFSKNFYNQRKTVTSRLLKNFLPCFSLFIYFKSNWKQTVIAPAQTTSGIQEMVSLQRDFYT